MNLAPVLFTFRRCPYAIRARMTLAYANICVEQFEVDLKNKPPELLRASPKSTVPVLILADGRILDESMAIIMWALQQSDPDGWLREELKDTCDTLIQTNDMSFKPILDNYKYPQRSEKKDPNYYREKTISYLEMLNSLLRQHTYLLTQHITYADIAIFPFIRQFYYVDPTWFESCNYKFLQNWLDSFLHSQLFLQVMKKPK